MLIFGVSFSARANTGWHPRHAEVVIEDPRRLAELSDCWWSFFTPGIRSASLATLIPSPNSTTAAVIGSGEPAAGPENDWVSSGFSGRGRATESTEVAA
jgi:hypothetical protein